MEFTVLGVVEARSANRSIPLPGVKARTLLALLSCHAGQVISTEMIIDSLWSGKPPAGTLGAMYTCVSALRRSLGNTVVVKQPGGYLLDVAKESVDLHRFDDLVNQARTVRSSQPRQAAQLLDHALALCTDTPLAGTAGDWADRERLRLEELRQTVIERRTAVRLRLGAGHEMINELRRLVQLHPHREVLRAQYMTALARAGRRAESINCFLEGRRIIVDELGVEPSHELNLLYQDILRDTVKSTPQNMILRDAPAQLPIVTGNLIGRTKEFAKTVEKLSDEAFPRMILWGRTGTGKSTLAAHAGHAVKRQFPDGQLYADFRAARSGPAAVLGGFLRALGCRDDALPQNAEERAALFRSISADRRLLVVLDHVRDPHAVRLLLPAGPGSGVLATSRYPLSGLDGVARLELDGLAGGDGLTLLAQAPGAERIAADPAAARRLVALVGGLPLALRIAGGRLAARPSLEIGTFATLLTNDLLNELSGGDRQLDIRRRLAADWRRLRPRDRTALRRWAWISPDPAGHQAAELRRTLSDERLLTDCPVATAYARERAVAEEDRQWLADQGAQQVLRFSSGRS
ncbi:SARP family transcriptional regulator [Pseudonocardiaceae bacterium YIM PH 21723]|nr:SARP family transcriptional regulator [Pseudonocardiaceae bacterium YIM PH 21723]